MRRGEKEKMTKQGGRERKKERRAHGHTHAQRAYLLTALAHFDVKRE